MLAELKLKNTKEIFFFVHFILILVCKKKCLVWSVLIAFWRTLILLEAASNVVRVRFSLIAGHVADTSGVRLWNFHNRSSKKSDMTFRSIINYN